MISHLFRESLDVRDEDSCYFENPALSTPITNITTENPLGRKFEPEFRASIEFLGFGEGI